MKALRARGREKSGGDAAILCGGPEQRGNYGRWRLRGVGGKSRHKGISCVARDTAEKDPVDEEEAKFS